MFRVYPAIFHKEDNAYWVEFPDLEGCVSDGGSLEEAMRNAQDSLGLYLVALSEENAPLPEPSELSEIRTDETVSYVATETDRYRRRTRAVKKTLSIPEWLAIEADKRNLSLSKVLQDGIRQQLEL